MYLLSCSSKPQSFTSTRSNSIPVKCTPRNKVYQKSFFQFSNSFALWLFQSTAGAQSYQSQPFQWLTSTQVIFFARALLGSHTFIDLNFSFRVESGIEAKYLCTVRTVNDVKLLVYQLKSEGTHEAGLSSVEQYRIQVLLHACIKKPQNDSPACMFQGTYN